MGFVVEMSRRRYDQWSLYDIDITHTYLPRWMACMRALARCTPSIRSFAGQGHMLLPLDF